MSNLKDKQKYCARCKDIYWNCLDVYKNDESFCKRERAAFEAACTKTWMKYWDKRRPYLKWRTKFERGDEDAEPPTQSNTNGGQSKRSTGKTGQFPHHSNENSEEYTYPKL